MEKRHFRLLACIDGEQGATAVIVAIILAVLLMLTALAVDVGHLYGVRNEMQNAADAGALAGAAFLYDPDDGSLTVDAAKNEARRVLQLNKTGKDFVDEFEIETGHWSFSSRTFTASGATEQLAGWETMSTAELDGNTSFINAVRALAKRSDTPSFFAGIFGLNQFLVAAEGVAWLGHGLPFEFDLPIALCEDTIETDDVYTCNQGRMANSGGNASSSMTAMWTNFSQKPCATASSSDMDALTDPCESISVKLSVGEGLGTQNGVQDNIYGNIVDCWIANADTDNDGIPDTLWRVTLPVVDCDSSNTCATLVGGVEVDIPWMIYKNDPQMKYVPTGMEDWPDDAGDCPSTETYEDRLSCWKSFVDHFQLENLPGPPVTDQDYEDMYQRRNIFFLTNCDFHKPRGQSGAQNFGIPAEIPKLVQ